MYIEKIEIVSAAKGSSLVRLARQHKRAQRNRYLAMSGRDAAQLVLQALSELRAQITHDQPAPRAARQKQNIGEILDMLQEQNRPGCSLWVTFSRNPSKRFSDDLRSSAKRCGLRLHFRRLLDKMVVIEIEDPAAADEKFLKSIGTS